MNLQQRLEQQKNRLKLIDMSKYLILILLALLLSTSQAFATQFNGFSRETQSSRLPIMDDTKDVDDILKHYPKYLHFVLAVGRRTNKRAANRLARKYLTLKRYSKVGAAKFLRGLRYEIVNKVQFSRLNPYKLRTSSKSMRRWVKRYLNTWYHEADEHLFRSVVLRKTR